MPITSRRLPTLIVYIMYCLVCWLFSTFCDNNPWPSLYHVLGLNLSSTLCAVLVASPRLA